MGIVFLVYALFVETDKTCYSDGVNWSTTPDADGLYKDVAHAFTVVFWGMGIICLLHLLLSINLVATFLMIFLRNEQLALLIDALVKIANGLLGIGFFIATFVVRLSDTGKLCSEHVLI